MLSKDDDRIDASMQSADDKPLKPLYKNPQSCMPQQGKVLAATATATSTSSRTSTSSDNNDAA